MTPEPAPSTPAPAPGRPVHLWLIVVGVLAVGGAAAARYVLMRDGDEPTGLAGRPGDATLAEREKVIQAQVEKIRAAAPAPDAKPAHPLSEVDKNPTPDESAFRIAEDHRTYDMRGWKPVTTGDGPNTAAVVMTRRLKVTKTAPADRMDFLGRTSGAALVMRADGPAAEGAQVFATRGRVPGKTGPDMLEQRLSVDVSKPPVGTPFDLTTRTTYWNSLQTPEEQWFGTIGPSGSEALSVLLLFPESKPFLGGGLRTGQAGAELEPYDGSQVVFKGPNGSWVYWEVPGPKPGQIYRVDWKW